LSITISACPWFVTTVQLSVGISNANPTILNNDVLTEGNGWPIIVARAWLANEAHAKC
jgi:hypothetical protein